MSTFPSHDIDPRRKDRDWRLQMAKAIWKDSSQVRSMFYHNAATYNKIKSYAHGRQDTAQYKKPMHIDEQSNKSYAVLDFKILPIVKNRRQIAVGKLQKSQYNIVATPIDALARNEADKYFADVKAKILLRNELLKQNPELADSPVLQPEPKEALDLEELEMQMEFGYKHNYAIEAEEGIQLIFDQNDITQCRHKVIEDLFDYGVAVYKDWMEPTGKVRFRSCDVRSVIASKCKYPDFRDLWYAGEVVEMNWADFREEANGQLDEAQFEKIQEGLGVKGGLQWESKKDDFKVRVLDVEWLSVNEQVYEDSTDKYGNPRRTKTDFKNRGKEGFFSNKKKVVYKAKWVLDTDIIYDDGLASFMKRDGNLSDTTLNYHIVATNFHDMKASGVMEDLIPIADQVQIAWLKIQNIRNQLLPYFIDINIGALEDVALSKGGDAQMTPKDLLQMVFQNGILLTRKDDVMNQNSNYNTINFVQTNYGAALAEAWNDLTNNINLIQEATGFNEATDGSTINPKTLNGATAAMQESTNNALYFIQHAEESLLLKLARAVMCRMRRAIKMGKVEGWIQSLGTNTVKFIQVSPDVDLHDFGLMLENKPTPEQKQKLQQMMDKGIMEGILDMTDVIMVENTPNLKQAEQILAYRIKKRKEEKQKEAQQMQQLNGQIQVQSAQAAEQAKQQTLQLEYSLKKDLIITEGQIQMQIKQMELTGKVQIGKDQADAKVKSTRITQGQDVPDDIPNLPVPQGGMMSGGMGQDMGGGMTGGMPQGIGDEMEMQDNPQEEQGEPMMQGMM